MIPADVTIVLTPMSADTIDVEVDGSTVGSVIRHDGLWWSSRRGGMARFQHSTFTAALTSLLRGTLADADADQSPQDACELCLGVKSYPTYPNCHREDTAA